MAFGMEFGGMWGKYLLSILRILAIGGIAWYLNSLVKANTKTTVVMSIALILAGAIGNMIDSAFYGMIFSHSFGQTATFFAGGYAGFLQGSVVDMFYFFQLSIVTFQIGCPFGEEIILFSSGLSLISLIQPLVLA